MNSLRIVSALTCCTQSLMLPAGSHSLSLHKLFILSLKSYKYSVFCLSLFISKTCNSDSCHCSSYLLKSHKGLPGSDSRIYLFKCLLAGDNLLRVVLSVCTSHSCRCDISSHALRECLQMCPQISSRLKDELIPFSVVKG